MAVLDQYSYIFAIGVIFAFLDAWNIGANDVANAFATSVSSRSLTMLQAMIIGAIMEFTGAVLAGSRVAGTIRNDIIQVSAFESTPSVLMLGMMCALVGSSLFLTLATKIGLPVSTTHCIIGGIIGIGFATVGADGVDWSWEGVSQVFAAWAIAPFVGGCFGAILFLVTKYTVLNNKKNALKWGFYTVPVYFALTSGVCTMLIVWKGAASLDLDDWGTAPTVGTIFGVAGGVALLSIVFLLPFLHVRLNREDWQLKPWDIIKGPLLLRRPMPPPIPAGVRLVPDYYEGHATQEELDSGNVMGVRDKPHPQQSDEESLEHISAETQAEKGTALNEVPAESSSSETEAPEGPRKRKNFLGLPEQSELSATAMSHPPIEGKWWEPRNLGTTFVWLFFRGVMVDVVKDQSHTNESKFIQRLITGKNLQKKHALVRHYDDKVEHLYSFLQVMTAATASFAHGANDVANAMGPLAAIYQIWQSGTVEDDSDVPIWVLVFGGASISLGLWMYGYNLIRNLGNRITLHSPSRGFCMELGAALTVVMATRLELPVSTTQIIIGSTVGVGLCSGEWKAINWRMVLWSYSGWFITLPSTALIAGLLMAFTINAPRWGLPA